MLFTLHDIEQECIVERGYYEFHNGEVIQKLGLRISVPSELMSSAPYNSSAYRFMQALRAAIVDYGIIEFPHLPVNRQNYTVAIRAPQEHSYSDNPYLSEPCQAPHQDTPPHPTAFWLDEPRRYSATWVLTQSGLEYFQRYQKDNVSLTLEQIHRHCVPYTIEQKSAQLLNHKPGLTLLDNSNIQQLYHAKTRQFSAVDTNPAFTHDAPLYSYNEIGLLHYIDSLDSRRGTDDRNQQEIAEVRYYLRNAQIHD